ncbi:hypothetical protein F5884DRAFT_790385 [Xylogone sp. PMI_703]|nr:hypothetical protein F5884DRAFT_790385 [Xylogone sp. PMI_703]
MSGRPESNGLLDGMDTTPPRALGESGRSHSIPRKPLPAMSTVSMVSSRESAPKYVKVSESSWSGDDNSPRGDGNAWLPGFWQQFPCKGIFSLTGCVGCIIASIVVLVVSDGQPTSSWRLSPTVYLAFLMTLTNVLARYTFNEGVKIAWWYRALRGSSVRDLRDHWEHADGFWSALFSGRRFNLTALGSIAVTVMVIDQPLIQRASTVVSVHKTSPANVTMNIAREIPWGFTGVETSRSKTVQVMTQPMIAAFNDHNSQTPIQQTSWGCNDTCVGFVEAGGLAAKCNSTTRPVEYSWQGGKVGALSSSPFNVNFSIVASAAPSNSSYFGKPSQIIMNVGYTNNSGYTNCTGLRTETTCYLSSATLRYPINVTRNVLTIGDVLNSEAIDSQPAPTLEFAGTDIETDDIIWTLGGLYVAASNLFSSNATYTWNTGIGGTLRLPDTLSSQFLELGPMDLNNVNNSAMLLSPNVCTANWADPTSFILSSFNDMTFRLSLYAANFPFRDTGAPSPAQIVAMQKSSAINVFNSDYRFLIASTVITMVSILLITPIFAGWWELGRRVTLNPIEVAKAFDAPSLQGPGSNAPLPQLVAIMGNRGLKFGEVETLVTGSGVKKQLKFADPVDVARPRSGEVYI